MIHSIETAATWLWRVAVAGLVAVITAITIAQVVARYGLNNSIVWAEELNRLLFVWLVVLGAAGADHMRIGLIADLPRFSRPLRVVAALGALGAIALLAWGAWKLSAMFAFDRYVTLDLSKWWYFAALMVGGAVWAVASVWREVFHPGGGAPL
ncbi:TRAP transporter small permease [Acuticoccus yangtzensis]|uniref:TRAP transporter small permease n=1 Tax=Acuticoccus yangtzensis TaxID=1443441 RepID=UPI00094996EE|nr:TRAP transporter small permease subunit [Acuticoccus yangtzensis]ORE91346.1 TRAP C4-dicarboxylate transport system permease DctM subunit [Stappia sp. 22II-S9-Z10]